MNISILHTLCYENAHFRLAGQPRRGAAVGNPGLRMTTGGGKASSDAGVWLEEGEMNLPYRPSGAGLALRLIATGARGYRAEVASRPFTLE